MTNVEPTAQTAQRPTTAGLHIEELEAGYGDLQILDGVNIDVAPGDYVAIVGPNGAGKSTTMKAVFGLTTVMGGDIRFQGDSIRGLQPEEVTRRGISYVPQNDNVFPNLTVRENLQMGAYIREGTPDRGLQSVFERFPVIEERQSQKAGTLSGGQQKMLAMGMALVIDPDLLLLDEPSAGLAPDLVDDLFDKIDQIHREGTSVMMVEQNAKTALRRSERGYVLVQGSNRGSGPGDELLQDPAVRQEFLGG